MWRCRGAAVALPVLLGLVAAAVALVDGPSLPDPVAVHFTLGGRPDGTLGRPAFLTLLVAVPWISAAVMYTAVTLRPRWSSSLVGLVGMVATSFTALGIVVARSQVGLASWTEAHASLLRFVAGTAAALTVGGAAGWVVQRQGSSDPRP